MLDALNSGQVITGPKYHLGNLMVGHIEKRFDGMVILLGADNYLGRIEGETIQASGSENFRLREVELYGRIVE